MAAEAERYRCWPPPWLVVIMAISQIVFFIFHISHFLTHPAHKGDSMHITWHGPYQFCSKLVFNPRRRHEVWRYISYFLVHAGLSHLLINVILQLLVGVLLEMSNGWFRIGLIYVTGILSGSLGTSTFVPTQYLAGSSGAVFALVGAHVASILLNWKEDEIVMRERLRGMLDAKGAITNKLRSTRKARLFQAIRLAFVILLCLLDFCKPLYHSHGDNLSASTSFSAHISGLTSGFLLGIIILRNREVELWETVLRVGCIIILFQLAVFTVFWNLFGNLVLKGMTGDINAEFFLAEDYGIADGHDHNGSCLYANHPLIETH